MSKLGKKLIAAAKEGVQMMNSKIPPDFKTQEERQEWIIRNADYFTVIWRKDYHNHRLEFKTLKTARGVCDLLTRNDRRAMVYAVAGIYDTFVPEEK